MLAFINILHSLISTELQLFDFHLVIITPNF